MTPSPVIPGQSGAEGKGIHATPVTEDTAGFPPPCGEVSAKRRVGVFALVSDRLSLTPPPPPPPHKGEES